MPKTLRASVYTNKKDEKGCQVSMPFEDAKAIAGNDKDTLKKLITAVKEAVKDSK